jgi:hypothetical protein
MAVDQSIAIFVSVIAAKGLDSRRIPAVTLAVARILPGLAAKVATTKLLQAGEALGDAAVAVEAIGKAVAVVVQVVEAEADFGG